MRCPLCGKETSVKDTRPSRREAQVSSVSRRRSCDSCDRNFRTEEHLLLPKVQKSNTSKSEPFSEYKIFVVLDRVFHGCERATEKIEQAWKLIRKRIGQLMMTGELENNVVTSHRLTEIVASVLQEIERTAMRRYLADRADDGSKLQENPQEIQERDNQESQTQMFDDS